MRSFAATAPEALVEKLMRTVTSEGSPLTPTHWVGFGAFHEDWPEQKEGETTMPGQTRTRGQRQRDLHPRLRDQYQSPALHPMLIAFMSLITLHIYREKQRYV